MCASGPWAHQTLQPPPLSSGAWLPVLKAIKLWCGDAEETDQSWGESLRSLLWRPSLSSGAALQLRPWHCFPPWTTLQPFLPCPSPALASLSWLRSHLVPLAMPGCPSSMAGLGCSSWANSACQLWLQWDGAVRGLPCPILPHCPEALCLHPTAHACCCLTDMSGSECVLFVKVYFARCSQVDVHI